jgi:hypothetical protein
MTKMVSQKDRFCSPPGPQRQPPARAETSFIVFNFFSCMCVARACLGKLIGVLSANMRRRKEGVLVPRRAARPFAAAGRRPTAVLLLLFRAGSTPRSASRMRLRSRSGRPFAAATTGRSRIAATWENGTFFECSFPYVCPEPVLVK